MILFTSMEMLYMNKFVIKTKFYNFLFAKGIIKSPNWIFGGD
jgi:hypothetical protein